LQLHTCTSRGGRASHTPERTPHWVTPARFERSQRGGFTRRAASWRTHEAPPVEGETLDEGGMTWPAPASSGELPSPSQSLLTPVVLDPSVTPMAPAGIFTHKRGVLYCTVLVTGRAPYSSAREGRLLQRRSGRRNGPRRRRGLAAAEGAQTGGLGRIRPVWPYLAGGGGGGGGGAAADRTAANDCAR
jgi:hypothetical protein